MHLNIYHTNDIHANFSFLGRVCAYLEEYRCQHKPLSQLTGRPQSWGLPLFIPGWLLSAYFSLAKRPHFQLKISRRFCLMTVVRYFLASQKRIFQVDYRPTTNLANLLRFGKKKAENP